jgi:hypothetical protein
VNLFPIRAHDSATSNRVSSSRPGAQSRTLTQLGANENHLQANTDERRLSSCSRARECGIRENSGGQRTNRNSHDFRYEVIGYSPNVLIANSPIVRPIEIDAVAAGEGALSTWTIRSAVTM